MVRFAHLLLWSGTTILAASSGGRYTVNDTLRGRMPKTFGGWTAAEDAAAKQEGEVKKEVRVGRSSIGMIPGEEAATPDKTKIHYPTTKSRVFSVVD